MSMTSSGTTGPRVLAGCRVVALDLVVTDLARARAFYENTLGFHTVGADASWAEYDAGQTLLRLCPARHERTGPDPRDSTADLTFLVDDIDAVRRALEARSVELSETLRYQIGATAGFHDPDGHKISLYEASAESQTWPSGAKIRAIRAATDGPRSTLLGGCPLIYLFLFVPDADAAYDCYHDVLGLRDLECRPCRRGATQDPRGVVKYDAGGLMLTTHHVDVGGPLPPPEKARGPQRDLSPAAMKALTPVFGVADPTPVLEAFAALGYPTGEAMTTDDGPRATFEDPFGRVYRLEATPATVTTPGAVRRRQILAARL